MTEVHGSLDKKVRSVSFDSRRIDTGYLFVAVKGFVSDGHYYIDNAIDLGASVIVCEDLPQILSDKITYVVVKDASFALGLMSSNFYDNPSSEIKLIGITGTNGKTTTTTLLHDLVTDLGYAAGLISTVVNKIGKTKIPSTHTTPNPM